MKAHVCAFLFLVKYVIVYPQNIITPSTDADSILRNVHKKLSSLKNIRYDNFRELNYSSEKYHNTSKWSVYFDFQTTDTIIGLKYQIDDSTSKQVFNGTEKFDLDQKTKTIQVNDGPHRNSFSSISALYNSILTIKNVLPLIIIDKTIIKAVTDTAINKNKYMLVTLNVGSRRIQNLGNNFDVMAAERNFIYKIIIDSNYVPVEVLQKNDVNNDFIKTSFSNVEINTVSPSEMSWYYSTYANDYKQQVDAVNLNLLPIGALSPQWQLKVFNKTMTFSSSDMKGKVILLDFWIKNCGPCIQSVPDLIELKNKFKDKNFEIVSINSYDSKEEVSWFCKKHNVDYSVLLNGKEVAEKYGVSAFPTFFIIDKTGKIIYSTSGFNTSVQTQLEQIIQKLL